MVTPARRSLGRAIMEKSARLVTAPEASVIRGPDRQHHAETVAQVLAKLTGEWARYFPEASVPPRVISVHYRPRRLSDIAKAEVAMGLTRVAIYIKIHKHHVSTPERVKQKARLEFETLRHLDEAMTAVPGCAVPKPIAFFPDEIAVVTEEVKGQNLYQLIKRALRPYAGWAGRRVVEAHCEASGFWLRQFQAVTQREARKSLREAGVLARLTSDLEVCVSRGLAQSDSVRLVRFCEDRLARLDGQAFPVVGTHPDFQPDNVVARADGVSVLDFTSFGYGLPWSDVGRFVATLEFFAKHPLYNRRRIAAFRVAFLRGYGLRGPEAEAVLVYAARSLVKAVRAVATWPAPSFVRRLRERQAVAFLSAWSRRVTNSSGGDALLAG
jgi:aminoglycoside phosphotransferase (APT) family kinase protein